VQPVPPIFILGDDLYVLPSVEYAERWIEPVAVEPSEKGFDAQGRLLRITVRGEVMRGVWTVNQSGARVEIALVEEGPGHAHELEMALRRWLDRTERQVDLSGMVLEDLVRLASRHMVGGSPRVGLMRRRLDILLGCLSLVLAVALIGLALAAAFKFGFHRRLVGAINLVGLAVFFALGGARILRIAVSRPKFHRAWVAARAGVRPDRWGVSASELSAEAGMKGGWGGTAALTFARAVAEGAHDIASHVISSALPEPGASSPSELDLCLQAALYFALTLHDPVAARRRLDQARAIPRSWFMRFVEPDYHRLAEAAVLLVEGKKPEADLALRLWHKRFNRNRSQTRAMYGWAADLLQRELQSLSS
jgi:hypothetical protein